MLDLSCMNLMSVMPLSIETTSDFCLFHLHNGFDIYTAPSSAPERVIAIVLSSTEIQVLWTEVPEIDRNGIITGYEIRYASVNSNGATIQFKTVGSGNDGDMINGLEELVTYNISVRAHTSEGPGPYSMPEQTVTTLENRESLTCSQSFTI